MTRLPLFISLILFAVATHAEDEEAIPLYQVEIIVFQHVFSDAAPEEVNRVNDYRMVARPLQLADEDDAANAEQAPGGDDGSANAGAEADPDDDTSMQAGGETAAWPPAVFGLADFELLPEEEPEPGLILQAGQLSETMQQAWDRLQRSPAYEPLHFTGWLQQAYPPEAQIPVRIHDELALPDPDLEDFVGPLPGPAEGVPQPGPATENDVDNTDGAEIEAVVDAAEFTSYRLDGQVSLVQRKFLHLDIDIEWREQMLRPPPADTQTRFSPGHVPETDLEDALPGWLVHTVLQRRQVHENRLEYFDTPWLGVIALITEVEIPGEPEAAGLPEPDGATPGIETDTPAENIPAGD